MMKIRYYVVFEGREKGVFGDWGQCRLRVHKARNRYRGFVTFQEVKDAVLFDMPERGPFLYSVAKENKSFMTYEGFRDFVLKQNLK